MQTSQVRWVVAAALVGWVVPSVALAEESGTRVVITVPADTEAAVPAPDALVEKLKVAGAPGPLQVMVHKSAQNGLSETRIDLWGKVMEASQIEATLRSSFASLAGAEIAVSTLDPSQKPAFPEDCKDVRPGQRCKVIKKEQHEKEAQPHQQKK